MNDEDASLAVRWEIDGEQLDKIDEHAEGPHNLPKLTFATDERRTETVRIDRKAEATDE
jgi:hypothetical protein